MKLWLKVSLIALILVGNGVLALVIDAWPKDQRPQYLFWKNYDNPQR